MSRTTSSSTSGDPSQRYSSQWRDYLSGTGLPPDEDSLFLSTMRHRVQNSDLLTSTDNECKAFNLVRENISRVSANLEMDESKTNTVVGELINKYWDGFSRWNVGKGDALMRVDQRLREIMEFEKAKELQTQRTNAPPQTTARGRLPVPGTCWRK